MNLWLPQLTDLRDCPGCSSGKENPCGAYPVSRVGEVELTLEGTRQEPERGELDKLDLLSLELSEATWYNTQLQSRHRDPHRGWAAKNSWEVGGTEMETDNRQEGRRGGGEAGAISSWAQGQGACGLETNQCCQWALDTDDSWLPQKGSPCPALEPPTQDRALPCPSSREWNQINCFLFSTFWRPRWLEVKRSDSKPKESGRLFSTLKQFATWEFPGGPVVRAQPFHCSDPSQINPWLGNLDSASHVEGQNK